MLNNIYREKLLNAILFFAKKVKHPSRVKMFKLLYFLDFMHFNQTGRPVTNQKYYAWRYGPVPRDLWEELASGELPQDFKQYISIEPYKMEPDKEGFNFKARRNADLSVFSPREKEILENLVFVFKDATPTQLSEFSHLKNEPWDKTIKEKGEWALIDFLLALDKESLISEEEAEEIQKEREEMFKNFPVKPTVE